MEQRLQKIMAEAGIGSRRFCEKLIESGRVSVNGEIVTQLGTKADPKKDKIVFDGKPVFNGQKKVYILLNKPTGYTSTRNDPHAKKTVLELVKDDAFLYPVGRLDVDTSGLLILTNDGDFTFAMTHPSHQIDKTYVADVDGRVQQSTMKLLERGIELEDGITAPAKTRLLSYTGAENMSKISVTIHEGKKRQIRRMFEAVGHKVISLTRIKYGSLDLGGVALGRYRHISNSEVAQMLKMAKGAAK